MPRSQKKGKVSTKNAPKSTSTLYDVTAVTSKPTPVNKKAPTKTIKKEKIKHHDRPIFEARPRNYGIGGHIQPPRDLTRFVRWPKYIRLQRQRQVLLKRLKVPPAVNQFKNALSKGDAKVLFTLLDKYKPETHIQKKERLKALAAAGPQAKPAGSKPKVVKYGLNHVTNLIEKREAKLVIIAHDVDPLELVLWLPTLCRKKDIPYVIVKSKARLGRVVNKKTAAVLAITDVHQKEQPDLALLVQKARDLFNSRYPQMMKTSGGKQMGFKHKMALLTAEKKKKKEADPTNKKK